MTLLTTIAPRGDDQLKKPVALKSLYDTVSNKWPHIQLVVQLDNRLHGKIYLFKFAGEITDGVVTSANLTEAGLKTNHEWGLHLTDPLLLQRIWLEVESAIEYPMISYELLHKMTLFVDQFRRSHPELSGQRDIDANLFNALLKAARRRPSESDWRSEMGKVFLKPWGTKDDPVLKEEQEPFSAKEDILDFPKGRPNDVEVNDIVVCFGTGSRCVLAVYRVLSNPEERPLAQQENDDHAKRWPWFIFGENCTPLFGGQWWRHDLTIDRLRNQFLSQHPNSPISAAGSESLAAFGFGAGRLLLSLEFGQFVVEHAIKVEESIAAGESPQSDADILSTSRAELEEGFQRAMLRIYERAKNEAHYDARKFFHLVGEHGGFSTARMLIASSKPSDGYTALWERKRLDLTVEAFVLENPRFHPLFDAQEIEACRRRLEQYGYFR